VCFKALMRLFCFSSCIVFGIDGICLHLSRHYLNEIKVRIEALPLDLSHACLSTSMTSALGATFEKGKKMIYILYIGEVLSRRNLLSIGIEFHVANFLNVLQYLLLEVLLREN
jgi:hypothetical protein